MISSIKDNSTDVLNSKEKEYENSGNLGQLIDKTRAEEINVGTVATVENPSYKTSLINDMSDIATSECSGLLDESKHSVHVGEISPL